MFQAETLAYREDWMDEGACKTLGPGANALFFSEDEDEQEIAKSYCRRCPVRLKCLRYAFRKSIDHGIFGGMKDSERRTVLKKKGRERVDILFVGLPPEKVLG